jgi:hypothetical protein
MNTNLQPLAQAIINHLQNAGEVDDFIDGVDKAPTVEEATPNVATFSMIKWVEVPGTYDRFLVPVGQVTYKVTIEATYTKFDDEV